jgi:hypothetical protein
MRKDMEKKLLWLHMQQAERGVGRRTNLRFLLKLMCLAGLGILSALYLWAALAFFFAVTP